MTGAVRSAPGSGRVRLDARERREQILHVATGLFRGRPEADVSLDEIAETVGVTRALINHHFGTKRALYVEVVRRVLAVNAVEVPDYVQGATPEDRLRESLERWFEHTARHPGLWSDAMRSGGMGDAELAGIVEEARENAVDRLVAVLGLGPLERLTPKERALLRGWEGFGETVIFQHLEYGRLTQEEAIELIVSGGIYCARRILRERGEAA